MDREICHRVVGVRTDHCGPRGKADFARKIDLSPSTYSYYERSRVPPAEVLIKIADLTGVSLEWLLTGRGPKYGRQSEASPSGQIQSAVHQLLAAHPHLAGPITAFLDLLQKVTAFPGQEEKPEPGREGKAEPGREGKPERAVPSLLKTAQLIPIVGRTAAGAVHFWGELDTPFDAAAYDRKIEEVLFAGRRRQEHEARLEAPPLGLPPCDVAIVQMSAPNEEDQVEFLACAAVKQLYPDAVAWRIDGDSMSPRFAEGDLVVGSARVPAQQRQPCIARLRDQIGVTCKIFRRQGDTLLLSSVNPSYETQRFDARELMWAVAVLASVRPQRPGVKGNRTRPRAAE